MAYGHVPAIAGVLWGFLFNPSVGVVNWLLKGVGIDFNYVINGNQGSCINQLKDLADKNRSLQTDNDNLALSIANLG